jgi:uncharacterized protein YbjT (DUF2867 family)
VTALIVGGTGHLGPVLVRLLIEGGRKTRVLTRDPARARGVLGEGVELVAGDVRDPISLAGSLEGTSTVVSAFSGFGDPHGPGTRTIDRDGNVALIRAARLAGVEHFVLLSVTQASPDHPMELMRSKYAAEQELKGSGLAWTIIRPALYMETWLDVAAGPLIQTGRTRVFGRGDNPLNLVSVRDVARFVEVALVDPGLRGATLEIGGPENVSMNELLATVEQMAGRTGRIDHVPVPVLRLMSVALRPFRPGLAGMIGASVVMDTRDMRFDASTTARRFPSITPTSLDAVVSERYRPDLRTSRDAAREGSPAWL